MDASTFERKRKELDDLKKKGAEIEGQKKALETEHENKEEECKALGIELAQLPTAIANVTEQIDGLERTIRNRINDALLVTNGNRPTV
jgi:chromosome segregation ATPase